MRTTKDAIRFHTARMFGSVPDEIETLLGKLPAQLNVDPFWYKDLLANRTAALEISFKHLGKRYQAILNLRKGKVITVTDLAWDRTNATWVATGNPVVLFN